ncbi:MFS transporter [Aminipila butyrica]|uniref:MFS transporter n=1 Tax=Aminipila butyrica TaxID=433296 RepID=A0A858BR44_9FIRM|nr:MFS transporter [Aminipila butyrica]QIB67802.1 MFS transporter [Aminipila butyrica]
MNQLHRNHDKDQPLFSKKAAPIMLIIGIAFIAANLRAPLTSVGPLVSLIRDNLYISNTLAGMITTLPLFAFALFSPLVPGMARRLGTEVVLFWSVVLLTLGLLLRSWAGSLALFLGTAILGLSISAGNVLIPSLIKKEFPRQVGVMTGVYSVSMNVFAALASGISIPLAVGLSLGWAGALKIWAILSLTAIVLWIPQLRRKKQKIAIVDKRTDMDVTDGTAELDAEWKKRNSLGKPVMKEINMWKSPLAWQVTFYMGLQSMVFYCMVAWLPDILIQQGMNPSNAGWMLSLMQLALIPVTFVGSVLAGRRASQQSLVVLGSLCVITGLLGLLFFGGAGLTGLWIIILGIGGGFTFSLSMMFFSLRTDQADEAARLSGMAQSIGYLLAAFGPMLFGYLHDTTSSWTIPLTILIGVAGLCFFAGLGAARDLSVRRALDNKPKVA